MSRQRARASGASSPLQLAVAVAALLALLSLCGAVHAFQSPIPSTRQRRHRPSTFTLGRQPVGNPQQQQQRSPRPSSPRALAAQHSSGGGGGGIDGLFRLIRNDALSLTIGSLCLVALVANRLLTPDLYDSQSRTDIIGVISAGGLLLNGLTLQVGTNACMHGGLRWAVWGLWVLIWSNYAYMDLIDLPPPHTHTPLRTWPSARQRPWSCRGTAWTTPTRAAAVEGG